MTARSSSAIALIAGTPQRAAVAQSVGVNLAASAAFYLVTSDRKHWAAAIGAAAFGVWLFAAAARGEPQR